MTDDTSIEPTGISRRSLIKKSAIVGGTAMWATPVVQSITNKAFAQQGSPGGLNAEISHFTLVLQNAAGAIFWQKYESGVPTSCGTNNGSCNPANNNNTDLTGATGPNPTEGGCPTGSHTVAPSGPNNVLVTVSVGWTLIFFAVKDAEFCQGPGQAGQPGVPVTGGNSIIILDPKPV